MENTKKRGRYGEGSVYLRKDGRFVAKYKGQVQYGESKTEANALLKQMRKEIDENGKMLRHPKFDAYFLRWLDSKKNFSPKTLFEHRNVYANHIKMALGDTPINKITSSQITNFLYEKAPNYAWGTIKKFFMPIYTCLRDAAAEGDIIRNPAAMVTLPDPTECKSSKKKIEILSCEEVRQLEAVAAMTNAKGDPLVERGWLVVLLLQTGLRVGELRALRWANVDYIKQELHICENVVTTNGEIDAHKAQNHFKKPKTPTSVRDIHINKMCRHALDEMKKFAERKGFDSEFVACGKYGQVMGASSIYQILQRMASYTNISKKVHPHMLRHTFATTALKVQKTDIHMLSQLMGHKDATTTYNLYIHETQSLRQEAYTRLDSLYDESLPNYGVKLGVSE